MSTESRFKRFDAEVRAIQWSGRNFEEIASFVKHHAPGWSVMRQAGSTWPILKQDHSGNVIVLAGAWKGDPCRGDFLTFDPKFGLRSFLYGEFTKYFEPLPIEDRISKCGPEDHVHCFDSDVGFLRIFSAMALLCSCGYSIDLYETGLRAIYGPTNSKIDWASTRPTK